MPKAAKDTSFSSVFLSKSALLKTLPAPKYFDIIDPSNAPKTGCVLIASSDKDVFCLRESFHEEFGLFKVLLQGEHTASTVPVEMRLDTAALSICLYIIDYCKQRSVSLTELADFDILTRTSQEPISGLMPLWEYIRDDESGNRLFQELVQAADYLGAPVLKTMFHYQMWYLLRNMDQEGIFAFFAIEHKPTKEDYDALREKYSYLTFTERPNKASKRS